MKTHQVIPGSPEWLAHRTTCWNAADAAAMLGCSHNESRTELLDRLLSGVHKEFSDYVQENVIDPGHEFEENALAIGEEVIGEDLGRLVGSLDVGLSKPLGASFDGITFMRDVTWEHKRLNAALRAAFAAIAASESVHSALPKAYRVQLEQQQIVSGAERSLFMASEWADNGTLVEEHHCWYESDPALRQEIIGGWKQLEADLAAHVPVKLVEKPVAKVVTSLPAVSVQVSGSLVVRDNFAKFEVALRSFIEKDLIVKPESDQDFVDMGAQIKALKEAEAALNAAEAQMLSQVEQVDAIKRTKEMLLKLASTNRIAAEKRLDARKVEIKGEEVAKGVTAFREHIESLNKRLGKPYMPAIAADFGGAIKNLRTVESLRNAVNTELARVKILANEQADRIEANLKHLRETARDYSFLFADTATIVLKSPDDLQALVTNRIAEHKAAEQKKQDDLREQIRNEEADRLQREADEARDAQAHKNAMALQEIQGIQQQVWIATGGRLGVRKGGTIDCIRDTLAETEAWPITEENFGALTKAAQGAKDKAVADIRELLASAVAKAATAVVVTPAPAPAPALARPAEAQAPASPPAPEHSLFALPKHTSGTDASEQPTMNLGEICARLGFTVTADFLTELGFAPTVVRSSRLYRPSDFKRICEAIVLHVSEVAARELADTES